MNRRKISLPGRRK
jgi:Patatin-like phospholipase